MEQRRQSQRGLRAVLPILTWAPTYDRTWLRGDVIAGITVAALVVPKSLGYAGIAAVPIQHGLFAAAAGALIYALFGTARQVATGPSSALAAVAGSTVALTAVSGGDAVQVVMAVTLLSGILYLLLAVFRMGWIAQFLSKAVITGFLFGAAIEVVVGEAGKITGNRASGATTWQEAVQWVRTLDQADATTALIGVGALVLVVGLRLIDKRIPGALVLVVVGLAVSRIFDLKSQGVALVGEVPKGLPTFGLPEWSAFDGNLTAIVTASLGLLLIGFSQTAGTARSLATKHGYRVDINQESTAQGMANIGSSIATGIPVSTSLSASSLNDRSGAKTPASSLVTGFAVLLTMLFLAPVFSDLPVPVLAALIVEAVVFGMMDVTEMRRLWRVKREDFWIAIATIVGVLSGGVLTGVGVGIVLSLIWLLRVSSQPTSPELGRMPDGVTFHPLAEDPEAKPLEHILVLRFDGALYYITADALEDRLRLAVQHSERPLSSVVLACEGINFIDSQGASEVTKLLDLAEQAGMSLHFATVKGSVAAVLARDGGLQRLNAGRLHPTIAAAVESAQREIDARELR